VNLDTPQGPILYLDGVTVSFDGFKALDSLSLIVEPGELRCIIGPNGAGKTTMMDVITGKTRPEAGEAHFGNAHDLTRSARRSRTRASTRSLASSACGARRTRRPICSRTARSSGWRSACCSCRTPGCSCSTSRWPE